MEADRHTSKLIGLVREFDKRTVSSCVNPTIKDFDGTKVLVNKEWIKQEVLREGTQLATNYKNMFEHVNYELSKAVENANK